MMKENQQKTNQLNQDKMNVDAPYNKRKVTREDLDNLNYEDFEEEYVYKPKFDW